MTTFPHAVVALVVSAAMLFAQARRVVVEYYHLDALGSVRVVTNAAGQVVAQHDFLPFGEEWNPQPSPDARKFTGKERDVETGLDYFGARYLSSKTARFTTTDPTYTLAENLVDPQRWNRYAYVRNSPLKLVDRDGRWPTSIHSSILANAFPGLGAADVRILQEESRRTDFDTLVSGLPPQDPANSFVHAMRGPGQTAADAGQQMQAFIQRNEEGARTSQPAHERGGGKGLSSDALSLLGNALHPVMDSTSPAHAPFQEWTGNGLLYSRPLVHSSTEASISPAQMAAAVAACREEF